MWPQWLSSPIRAEPKTKSQPFDFHCSSFKDIDSLFRDRPHQKPSVFHRVRTATAVLRHWATHRPAASPPETVVIYFTSLRVVRRTYEDCRTVRSILRAFRVPIDERDVSMDSSFLRELQGIAAVKGVALPRVFVGGKCIGGADEVRELHDRGELKRLVGWSPAAERRRGCEVCGGHRFVLCEECSGSHKVHVEKSGFKSCSACNVNGLIRCPHCFPLNLKSK